MGKNWSKIKFDRVVGERGRGGCVGVGGRNPVVFWRDTETQTATETGTATGTESEQWV